MNRPLVTVVTPSFNQGHFIRATIESVLSQDYPRVEYIIMDGGSTDETASVAAEYAGRLTFLSERDRGQSHAINKGFQMAKGEVVSWLNSDDTILPGAIGHAVDALEANPLLGAVYGEGYLIDYEGNVTCRFPATEPFNLWKLVYLSDYILQQTVYFRRRVFDEVGFLDENLHWGMDWDILIRIGKRYPMQYIPEYMGCLREYGAAKTFSGGARRHRELARIMRRHGGLARPPGYWTYGLDTWQKIVCDRIAPVTPQFFRKGVAHAAHLCISRILRTAQGLYSDGWAAPRLKYMLPAGAGAVQLRGSLPNLGKALEGQSLSILEKGRVLSRTSIPWGDFEIVFTPPHEDVLLVEVVADKYVVPANDPRELAYLFKGMER